jgi:hypothetical protein
MAMVDSILNSVSEPYVPHNKYAPFETAYFNFH